MKNHLAAIQMVSTSDVDENLRAVERMAREATAQGAEVIVLPENFAFMGKRERDKVELAEMEGSGKIQKFISSLAKELAIWIVAGTIPIQAKAELSGKSLSSTSTKLMLCECKAELSGKSLSSTSTKLMPCGCNDKGKVTATCFVYNEKGKQVARYDKIHLFDVNFPDDLSESYKESATIEKGKCSVVLDSPVGRLGLAVCYDVRFPELFREMLKDGLDVIALPSAFTEKTGRAHWEVLLSARAIENQCYLVAANQGGLHENGRTTFGHSSIIGPWGELLASRDKGAGVISAPLDRNKQARIRAEFPALLHRQN